MNKQDTSWENSAKDYHALVGTQGSYYHQRLILPHALRLLNLSASASLLELGCGQGILARNIPDSVTYFGLDASTSLIKTAKSLQQNSTKRYFKVQDVAKPFSLTKHNFSHCAIILALQNMPSFEAVIANAAAHLKSKGKLLIILNHPTFRIPKHSSWGMEPHTQFRRIDRYMSPLKIPIDMTPGKETKTLTWSFHAPLSAYSSVFYRHHFLIEKIEEWVSDKTSVGKNAARENKAREEFPLFMGILLEKR